MPVLNSSQNAESKWLDIILTSDGKVEEHKKLVAKEKLEQFPYIVSEEFGRELQIGKLPYVVLANSEGQIRAHGLVNSREHIESIFEAHERGVESIQEYLEQQGVEAS